MGKNFAFLKTSDLWKNISRSDYFFFNFYFFLFLHFVFYLGLIFFISYFLFFHFFFFAFSIQICYLSFHCVLLIINYNQGAEIEIKAQKFWKHSGTLSFQHIFSCWTRIWPSFFNIFCPISKKLYFLVFFPIS